MRIKKPSYFAKLTLGGGGGGVWGSGPSADEALKRVCKEAREFAKPFGGLKKEARLDVLVYLIPEGCYAYWDDRAVFAVDRETDKIAQYATPVYRYQEVDPRRPLSTCRLGDPWECYADKGEALRRFNEEKAAPIGEKVEA